MSGAVVRLGHGDAAGDRHGIDVDEIPAGNWPR
jgi:hypothetical protein